MEKKIKATLFISKEKRNKIRDSGLSLEDYFNRLYEASERFKMDKWSNGNFHLNFNRVSIIRSETINLILNHFDEGVLLNVGKEVGEKIRNQMKYNLNFEPSDHTSRKKMIEILNSYTGWGIFIINEEYITIRNSIFRRPIFLHGYLEGYINVELEIIDSNPEQIVFKIIEKLPKYNYMQFRKDFEDDFNNFVKDGFDLFCIIDRAGIITYINPPLETFFGYSVDKIIGKHFKEFIDKSVIHEVNNAFNNCLIHGSSGKIKVKVHSKEDLPLIKTLFVPIILNENVSGVQVIGKVFSEH